MYSSWILGAMRSFVQDIDYKEQSQLGDGEGVSLTALSVCQEALAVVFDPYQDLQVKFFYLDEVCLPVLLRCSSGSLQAMLCRCSDLRIDPSSSGGSAGQQGALIQQLMALVTKNLTLIPSLGASSTSASDADAISTSLLQTCCCFSILETIYDRYRPIFLINSVQSTHNFSTFPLPFPHSLSLPLPLSYCA